MSTTATTPAPTADPADRIGALREQIDACDAEIIELVQRRLAVSARDRRPPRRLRRHPAVPLPRVAGAGPVPRRPGRRRRDARADAAAAGPRPALTPGGPAGRPGQPVRTPRLPSRSGTAAAGTGRASRKPCARGQPIRRSADSCPGRSTPSAITGSVRSRASRNTAPSSVASRSSVSIRARNDRSILTDSSDSAPSRASEDCPTPKSSSETPTPRSAQLADHPLRGLLVRQQPRLGQLEHQLARHQAVPADQLAHARHQPGPGQRGRRDVDVHRQDVVAVGRPARDPLARLRQQLTGQLVEQPRPLRDRDEDVGTDDVPLRRPAGQRLQRHHPAAAQVHDRLVGQRDLPGVQARRSSPASPSGSTSSRLSPGR